MFEYNICNMPDENIFFRQCEALEKRIECIQKGDLLQDVDSSLIQEYSLDRKKILVHNDLYVGCVWIGSEIDLTQFFPAAKSAIQETFEGVPY